MWLTTGKCGDLYIPPYINFILSNCNFYLLKSWQESQGQGMPFYLSQDLVHFILTILKCLPDDTVGDFKKILAAQIGTPAEKIGMYIWFCSLILDILYLHTSSQFWRKATPPTKITSPLLTTKFTTVWISSFITLKTKQFYSRIHKRRNKTRYLFIMYNKNFKDGRKGEKNKLYNHQQCLTTLNTRLRISGGLCTLIFTVLNVFLDLLEVQVTVNGGSLVALEGLFHKRSSLAGVWLEL